MNRRQILAASAWLPIGYVVSGMSSCGGVAVVSQQAAQDVSLIANGLSSALSGLGNVQGISASLVGTVGSYVAAIQKVASSVTAGMANATAASAVQQIETLLNSIVGALAGLALPSPFGPVLAAATVLLPIVEAAIGMVVAAVHPAPAASAMTPDAARLVLQAATAK